MEPRHGDATPDLEARLGLRGPGDGPPIVEQQGGEGDEALVPGAALEVAEGRRGGAKGVEADGTGSDQSVAHVRELGLRDVIQGAGLPE